MKIVGCGLLIVACSIAGWAQGTPGTLRCAFAGSLDVHATREPSSAVLAVVRCGDPIMIIDQQFGSPHVRTIDGKDGFITGVNLGQWSVEAERTATRIPDTQAETKQPQRRSLEVGGLAFSFRRQSGLNFYGASATFGGHVSDHFSLVGEFGFHDTWTDVDSFRGVTYNLGPRFYLLSTDHRVAPFLELLIGGVRAREKGTAILRSQLVTFKNNVNGFSALTGGGLDVRLTPSLTWRAAEVDYSFMHLVEILDAAIPSHGIRAGTGFVFRFGH